ncbi:MAG: hypothetical protein ACOX8W_09190 [bacterium]
MKATKKQLMQAVLAECKVIDDNLVCEGVSCAAAETDMCCGMCDRAARCPDCCEFVASLLARLSKE